MPDTAAPPEPIAQDKSLVPLAHPEACERLLTARNLMALALVLVFAVQQLVPYWLEVPVGRSADLLVSGQKTVETILVLIIGFYFGTSQSSAQKDSAILRQLPPAAPAALPAPSGADIVVEGNATVEAKEVTHAAEPTATGTGGPHPGPLADPGPQSGEGRPPE